MPTENTQRCPKCNDPDFVFEQGCLKCGWALSDQIEPTTDVPGRVCQRGVDGMKKKQQEVPAALDKIMDVVLSYRPKPKRKKPRKRKRAKRAN